MPVQGGGTATYPGAWVVEQGQPFAVIFLADSRADLQYWEFEWASTGRWNRSPVLPIPHYIMDTWDSSNNRDYLVLQAAAAAADGTIPAQFLGTDWLGLTYCDCDDPENLCDDCLEIFEQITSLDGVDISGNRLRMFVSDGSVELVLPSPPANQTAFPGRRINIWSSVRSDLNLTGVSGPTVGQYFVVVDAPPLGPLMWCRDAHANVARGPGEMIGTAGYYFPVQGIIDLGIINVGTALGVGDLTVHLENVADGTVNWRLFPREDVTPVPGLYLPCNVAGCANVITCTSGGHGITGVNNTAFNRASGEPGPSVLHITGTPTAAGIFYFYLIANDSRVAQVPNGDNQHLIQQFRITVRSEDQEPDPILGPFVHPRVTALPRLVFGEFFEEYIYIERLTLANMNISDFINVEGYGGYDPNNPPPIPDGLTFVWVSDVTGLPADADSRARIRVSGYPQYVGFQSFVVIARNDGGVHARAFSFIVDCCEDYPGCDCTVQPPPPPCCDDYPDCDCDALEEVRPGAIRDAEFITAEDLGMLEQHVLFVDSFGFMGVELTGRELAAAEALLGGPVTAQALGILAQHVLWVDSFGFMGTPIPGWTLDGWVGLS
jgi:hypothetical protein